MTAKETKTKNIYDVNLGVMRESIYMMMPMDIHICLFLSNLLLPDSVCSSQEVLCPNNGRAAGWLLDTYY